MEKIERKIRKKILEKLEAIEKEKGVEILFAVESGSRAWGFASPDSDYDIRFVYRHKKEWYLDLWESKDTIQFMTEDDLDGSGWDVRKALRLLAKSNASFLGWVFSPIIYKDDKGVLELFKKRAIESFNPVAGFYHYDSMSKTFKEKLMGDELTIKQFFYAIRTALSAKWILETASIPPVEFIELFRLLDDSCKKELQSLMEVKGESDEKSKVEIPEFLVEYTSLLIEKNYDTKHLVKSKSADKLKFNEVFLKMVE